MWVPKVSITSMGDLYRHGGRQHAEHQLVGAGVGEGPDRFDDLLGRADADVTRPDLGFETFELGLREHVRPFRDVCWSGEGVEIPVDEARVIAGGHVAGDFSCPVSVLQTQHLARHHDLVVDVSGLPAATHIGGCGVRVWLGKDVAAGHREEAAIELVLASRHMCLNWVTISSSISLTMSGSWIPNPRCSVVEEPRPIPNSKRPFERWSSIAARSAMRAGWLTGGVMSKIPEPRWILSVWPVM
jgi:hypothetical protein